MRKKIANLVFLAAFFALLSFPSLFSLSELKQQSKKTYLEFAGLAPGLLVNAAADLPEEFSDTFSNHFGLHTQLVDILQRYRLEVLDETIFPQVVIGKEDWLYYSGEKNIEDFECVSPFNNDELEAIKKRLLEWDSELTAQGIRFYFVIAPNKESIYPEYLPEFIRQIPRACRIDQVVDMLETTDLAVLDLRKPLRSAAEKQLVYHRTDTHWNDLGAITASQELLQMIREDFPELDAPSINKYDAVEKMFSGDLAVMLPQSERFVESETTLVPHDGYHAQMHEDENGNIQSVLPNSALPSAIVIRDSFSDALIPFLSDHFSRIVFVKSFALDLDLVEAEQPDVVIYELAQRYLTMLR